jgi:alanine dehydrogenase
MKIALVKESRPGETRVGLTPDAVKALVGEGWEVDVQRDAGLLAHYTNDSYEAVGATTPWATSPFASTRRASRKPAN